MWEDNIWNEMKRFRSSMNNLFGARDFTDDSLEFEPRNYRQAWADLQENDKEFHIAVEIPGVSKEDIDLQVLDNGRLIIKAQKKFDKEFTDELEDDSEDEMEDDCCSSEGCGCQRGKKYRYSQLQSYAGFYKTVDLPENADTQNLTANYKEGVLKITIPKIPVEERKRAIKIN